MSAAPVLKAESLRVGYGGKPVLLDVSIELRPNEVLCVIGHNGAGKSTLMRTLFGLVKQQAGRVLVDGNVLPRHVPRALAAQGVAMVPEGRGVFPGLTVKEIFALGMWSAGVPEAERARAGRMGDAGAAARCAISTTSAPACCRADSSRWCRSAGRCWRVRAAC